MGTQVTGGEVVLVSLLQKVFHIALRDEGEYRHSADLVPSKRLQFDILEVDELRLEHGQGILEF